MKDASPAGWFGTGHRATVGTEARPFDPQRTVEMSVPATPPPPLPGSVDAAGLGGYGATPALGYMLVRGSTTPTEEAARRQELTARAAEQGLLLQGIFVERDDNPGHAYAELIDALRSSGIRSVLAPAVGHFGQLPGVQRAMVNWIERETSATVLVLYAGTTDESGHGPEPATESRGLAP